MTDKMREALGALDTLAGVHVDTPRTGYLALKYHEELETIRSALNSPLPAAQVPDDLRAQGLTVAIHNDYRLDGESHTFWLLTDKSGMSYKGEGRSDAEALNEIRGQLTAAPSIAEKRETAVSLGEKLFSFASQQDWINKAQRIWKKHQVRGEDTLCIDQLGRVCDMGKHFREAEEDNAYPIDVFTRRPEPPEVQT